MCNFMPKDGVDGCASGADRQVDRASDIVEELASGGVRPHGPSARDRAALLGDAHLVKADNGQLARVGMVEPGWWLKRRTGEHGGAVGQEGGQQDKAVQGRIFPKVS
jgi:hypothetical protein